MVLTVLMYVLEAIEEVFWEEARKKMTRLEKGLTLLLSPIWPMFTLVKTSWNQFKSEAISEDSKKEKKKIEKLTQTSNRAHLIEVSMESSLQPLIQLHAILSQLLKKGGLTGFSWTKAMEAFWEKDIMTILDLGQDFNTQVKCILTIAKI